MRGPADRVKLSRRLPRWTDDNDGRADFATYVPSTGMWYILYSGGSSITRAWGGAGYAAMPQYP